MVRRILMVAAVLLILGGLGFYTFRCQWPPDRGPRLSVRDGKAQQARQAILQYGCGSCHELASLRKATGRVGPRLTDIREQVYIAGVLPNQPENMVHWLMDPGDASPRTAMPDLGVTEQDARNMAAYLYASSEGCSP